VWLNLGDSYSSGGRRTTTNQSLRGDKDYGVTRPAPSKGIKPKDLIGIPWRVAFALQQDGWYLRQDIIWHKPNPMPESVRDRCTKAHEYIFLLSKNVKYYYDHEAIKEPSAEGTLLRLSQKNLQNQKGSERAHAGVKSNGNMKAVGGLKKNKRSVWTVTTKPFKEAHFATFPMDLIEPCVLAGCPEEGTVLDPFGGAGTTGIVASNHNRNAILCELNDEYSDIAEKRIESNLPLFSAKN
jgi:site-specific DNA-methyltransferase (adenine-specific)